jgi:cytochrome bd-type quinol oxidase subunit 2
MPELATSHNLTAIVIPALGIGFLVVLVALLARWILKSVHEEEAERGHRATVRSLLAVIAVGYLGLAGLFFPLLEKVHWILAATEFVGPVLIALFWFAYWTVRKRSAPTNSRLEDEQGRANSEQT